MDAPLSKNLEYTLATHSLERLMPSEHAIELCEKIYGQKITAEAAVDAILKAHGLKREHQHV